MQTTITDSDTIETLTVKLAARRVIVLRLVKCGLSWRVLASRTDTLRPAVAYGRSPGAALRRVAACLDPAGA